MHYYATRAALLVPDITTFFSSFFLFILTLPISLALFILSFASTITALADPRLETGYLAA